MMLSLLVIAFFLHYADFALMPLVNEEYNVRRCVKRIIDVYADDDTTIFAIYGNHTGGKFLPHPIQNPLISINVHEKVYSVSYQTRKELLIIDLLDVDLHIMWKLGFFNSADMLRRKFLWTWPLRVMGNFPNFVHYMWKNEIHDPIFLVYDYDFESNFTEVISVDKHHPLNRCVVIKNVSRFSCDQIKKNRNKKFYRNYSKCRLTYRLDSSFQHSKLELDYITEFVVREIIATLNLSLSLKHKLDQTTMHDHYLLILHELKLCRHKVPSPKKMGSLEVFKLIYKWECWIFILLSFVVTCLVWWAISTCRWSIRFSSTVLDVYSITLTGAINTIPKCFSLRCLFLTYVIYSIHIQIGFTSNLVTLLTVPQYSEIKTAEELADSNIPIIISRSSANVILNMTHEGNNIFKKIKDKIIVLSDEERNKFLENDQFMESASAIVPMDAVRLMVQVLQRKVYFIPNEHIRTEVFAFNTRPGSLITEDANKVINSLVESGIIEHEKRIYKKIAHDLVKDYEKTQSFKENVVLGMEHVYPIFLFWLFGILVATIVFVLEHVTYTYKNKKNT
ncbi:hypothetical protein FQA39_LY16160 [Lamprigera yunnana]|nr:hypothetical protein FQA39_LY16160 [Lamprigera yunnana]